MVINKARASEIIASLPDKIDVSIRQAKNGVWIADLPEYDIFTEADSPIELDFFINDLIFSYFEVPDMVRGFVKYTPSPAESEEESQVRKPSWEEIAFVKYFSPEADFYFK